MIDIVPTIYEAAGITPPEVLDGVKQKPIEGVSLVYTFDNAKAPTQHPDAVFRARGQSRHLQGRMDGEHDAVATAMDDNAPRSIPMTSNGSCTTSTRISVRPTISPTSTPRS